MPITRLAPSPTGALHLGNVRTFLVNWALARQQGWKVILRIEDLDGPRIKAEAAQEAIDLLEWLGLDWDQGPLYQANNLEPYLAALAQLRDQGLAYPCRCTRSQILAASLSAPHQGDHELRYPGTCRPTKPLAESDRELRNPNVGWRLLTPDSRVMFEDQFAGNQSSNPQNEVGDFLIATKGGLPSYQLAVVVDDTRQEVDRIVRGDDLLGSTARQILLYQALGLGPLPEYTHLPIVVGPDGRRLAKRHGDTRVSEFRRQGATASRVIGLMAEWCGMGLRHEMSAVDFVETFSLDKLPTEQITYLADDAAWLIQK